MITRSKAKLLQQQQNNNIIEKEDIKPNVKKEDIKPNIKKEVKIPKLQYDNSNKTDMKNLLKNLNINERFTKPPKKYKWDKVKENTFPMEDYNFMADLIEFPKTKKGWKYLLVVVDLWSNDFDIEHMQTKTSYECTQAFKQILKRDYLKLPKASIRTDNGTEFKGDFKEFLESNKIMHRLALPYRHKQTANVESLNKTLTRIFMTYLTNVSKETSTNYVEWIDIIDDVRKELNEARKKNPDEDPYNLNHIPYNKKEPKFEVGDIVHRKLEVPKNIYGELESNTNWRSGDNRFDADEKLKIVKVLNYPNNNRYILNTVPNVAYAEEELLDAEDEDEYFIVKEIIDQKVMKGKTYYKVWWKKQLKKDSTWEPLDRLLEDGIGEYIQEYHNKIREKQKKQREKEMKKRKK